MNGKKVFVVAVILMALLAIVRQALAYNEYYAWNVVAINGYDNADQETGVSLTLADESGNECWGIIVIANPVPYIDEIEGAGCSGVPYEDANVLAELVKTHFIGYYPMMGWEIVGMTKTEFWATVNDSVPTIPTVEFPGPFSIFQIDGSNGTVSVRFGIECEASRFTFSTEFQPLEFHQVDHHCPGGIMEDEAGYFVDELVSWLRDGKEMNVAIENRTLESVQAEALQAYENASAPVVIVGPPPTVPTPPPTLMPPPATFGPMVFLPMVNR